MERILSDKDLYCTRSYELMRQQYLESFEGKMELLVKQISLIKIRKLRSEFECMLGWITEEQFKKTKLACEHEIKAIETTIESIKNKIKKLNALEF